MGKISILTKEQKILLDLISGNEYLTANFYFTGGTALSEFYYHHRYSEDLDFFSLNKIDQQIIFGLVTEWGKKYNFRFTSRFVEVVYRFNINFDNKVNVKVDFGYYPHKLIEPSKQKYEQMSIDSLVDIGANKLLTINQRTDIKDFVDLYYLLKDRFTFWDLIYSTQAKFKRSDFDLLILAEDLLKVEDFTALPRMILPVSLNQLKKFFRNEAKKLGAKVT